MENIDNVNFLILLSVLFSAIIFSSKIMGLLALLFSGLVVFKKIFKPSEYNFSNYEKTLFIFFLIVTMSLFGSTLFKLSLHGYIKTVIYILFFYCANIFFNDNKNKIMPTVIFVCALMSFESIIAIIQNSSDVAEIS